MKKNLLTLGLLAVSFSLQAQNNVLLHVDDTGLMYVSKGTLVYNGGGLQSRGSGVVDLHGNMMVVGTSSDGIQTVATNGTSGTTNTPNPTNIIIRLNNDTSSRATDSYGQLYIKGIPQNNITGSVSKEFAATKHGDYQQIGMTFYDKTFNSFGTELGSTSAPAFTESRWTKKEILKWNNEKLRWDGSTEYTTPITSATAPGITIGLNTKTTSTDRTAYYTFGTASWDPTTVHTLKGRPFADGITGTGNRIPLNTTNQSSVTFGTGGNSRNIYQEKYNTYIWDNFDDVTSAWNSATNWGKNVFQFSNPYFTTIDLSMIGYDEANATITTTDNNALTNIQAIVVDPNSVAYSTTAGTSQGTYAQTQVVTFNIGGTLPTVPVGNLNALLIKPLGTFKIKLRNNTAQSLDFDNLRRFETSKTRYESQVSYDVTAAKNVNTNSIKQLGVLALDASGNQIGETYYVVSPTFTTGFIANPSLSSVQATTGSTAIIQTFEEATTGGADPNYSSAYRLYINEANESDFLGKRVDMNVYGSNIASLKFQIRENAILIPDNTHALSAGTGFYYKEGNGQSVEIKQGDVIPVANSNYGLYYGIPTGTLSTNNVDKSTSRTVVTYNPSISNYIVRFDPLWKSASVEVYDASGKLVISEKSFKTDSDFVIKLDSAIHAVYIVKVVGNDGTIVTSKIITQ